MAGFWYSTRQVGNTATCALALGRAAASGRLLNHVEKRCRA